ncbi:MAG TPA: hypothetical protein VNZ45_10185 [Bacteroidia bacterium]|jgi:hypothetical protein|nr:hypothetical protein [Bacteroidia bacterium]
MKRIAVLGVLLCMLLPALQGKAQITPVATEKSSSTKFITEQNGIKVFVHYTANASDSKATPQVSFYNSTDKSVVMKWTIKNKLGEVIFNASEITIQAGRSETTPFSPVLIDAFGDKDKTFEINLKN